MVDLFEMHEEMTCQVVVGVFDSSICVEHEFDALEPLCMVPPDDVAELGTHDVNLLTQHTSGGTEPTNEPHAAPKNPKAASELEPDREPDIFDNEEEYVGIDDEAMYDEEPTHQTEFPQPHVDPSFDNANKCSCREWQVTGKPCKHALAWILSNRGMRIDDFVHEYYSVARFKATYEDRVEPMPDRSQWPEIDLGFKVHPPLLGRAAGRPKVQRQRGCLEKNPDKKKVRCSRCGGFGHFAKTCKLEMVGEDGETATTKKRLALP